MKINFNNIFKEGTRYKSLFLSLLLCAIGSGLHKGILDNYVAEMAQMNELDRGIMEFFREVPGLLLVLILAIFYKSSAEKMYKLSMVFMAAGMVLQSVIDPVKALVILAIFIYSTGEHIQIGMRNTLTLEYSHEGHGGVALGWQNSMMQIGNLIGYISVIGAFAWVASSALFQPVFMIAA